MNSFRLLLCDKSGILLVGAKKRKKSSTNKRDKKKCQHEFVLKVKCGRWSRKKC